MLRDVASFYPEDAAEWGRAQARLRYLLKKRGTKFFTIDLVTAGKHFDRCLSDGIYFPCPVPAMGTRQGEVIPRLFRGLLRRIFGRRSGKLRINIDVVAVSVLRQLYYAAKKVRMDCDDPATYKTVAEFFDVEKAIQPPSLDWDGDGFSFVSGDRPTLCEPVSQLQRRDGDGDQYDLRLYAPGGDPLKSSSEVFRDFNSRYPRLLHTIQRVADECASALGRFEASEIIPKHGPGAVSDREGESKFDFPHWPEKLSNLFQAEEFAYYNAASVWSDSEDGGPLLSKGEPPSKLLAVPKTQKAPRLIASEPTAHQWMQQGILGLLTSKMDKTWLKNCVSIRDQDPSRVLACLASAQGHLSTIDLSSASDRVSCWLVERIFRANEEFLSTCHAVRTRWLVQTLDKKLPRFHKLKKFTTMGSALTFPVQSIIYAIVSVGVDLWSVYAPAKEGSRTLLVDPTRFSARRFADETTWSSKRVRVFGDDIIHPVESTTLLLEVLTLLGLEVNATKTFYSGFFRESCGLDAYHGIDVTPCYVNEVPSDTEPESLVSVVQSSNNFHLRGMWHTADYLVHTLPQWLRKGLAVKGVGSGAFGLSSFVGADVSHLKRRWNDQLQHWEVRAFAATQTPKKSGIRGSSALLQYFTERPLPDSKWEHGVGLRVPLKLRRKGIAEYNFI